MATKEEAQQALLDAIESVAKKAPNTNTAPVLQAAGEATAHFAAAWRTLEDRD